MIFLVYADNEKQEILQSRFYFLLAPP